jgi:prolipoprotein diacylglyceryltransferase
MIFLANNAAAITALATVVIAVFTFLMWLVSHRIHQATKQRDKEMTDLYLNIMSTILVSGRTVGEADLAVRLIKEQKEKLSKLFVTTEP